MKNMAFYIDDTTDQQPKIHDALTETVCTAQKRRARNAKEPCFSILSAVRLAVKEQTRRSAAVSSGSCSSTLMRFRSAVMLWSTDEMGDACQSDRIVLHCDQLLLYTGYFKQAILFFFFRIYWIDLNI